MSLTPPSDPMNFIIKGDLDILNGLSSDNGNGTVYIRDAGLFVQGLTDLDQVTINTTDGEFSVSGSNRVVFNMTDAIEFTATDTSFWTTTAGTLSLSATATNGNGKISLTAAGTGTNSILLDATNATSGQITIQSAGGSTSTDAVKILASDTTDGNILIQGSGDFSSTNPAVKIYADNATSGQILVESASDATGSDSIKLNATGTTGGNVSIVGAGSTVPAVLLDATNATSGKIQIQSAGDSSTENAIEILASGTSEGNILISSAGTNTNQIPIRLLATNTTSGQILAQASGNLSNAVRILSSNATGGGIDIDATGGPIAIDTQNTATGVTIATATAGVPVTIGTSTSITTVAGDFIVQGTTTTFNTETLTVEDNVIVLNSGNGEIGLDSGVIVRRYQTPNGAGTGDVVNYPNPIQESGEFQAGSATPDTLVLAAHTDTTTTDYYKGWWIKITSGTGVNQVRRIKSYDETTNTATLYVTADNVVGNNSPPFNDGLDLVTAPAAADTYELYCAPYVSTLYDESADTWTLATSSLAPDAISTGGTSTLAIQQYQNLDAGSLDSNPMIFHNVKGTASTTTITLTLRGHGQTTGDRVGISNSLGFTPSITSGVYTVTVLTANTLTITVSSSTTHATGASVTVKLYDTSIVYTNVLLPHDPEYGISIPGVSVFQDIIIPKTSTSTFLVNVATTTYGAYILLVADLNNTNGSFGVFSAASSGTGGSVSRLSGSKGADNQRIDATWTSSNTVGIYQSPAGSGGGNYTYRVRVFSSL